MSLQTTLVLTALVIAAGTATAQTDTSSSLSVDPRVGLRGGWMNAAQASHNMVLVASRPRPSGFFDPTNAGNFSFANADMAFAGNFAFIGGYHGFQVWDVSAPASPRVRSSWVCPGGQGDLSVYRNLLFMSVEETRGRVDCGTQGVLDSASADRFRGIRIFDISDIDRPRQVGAVQTCRGSHTHTLVTDPRDAANVYVYVSGTSPVRPAAELAGCSGLPPAQDPNTALFRIEIIRVPLAAPQTARVVNAPRLFADSTGAIAGLWKGGTHGEGTQETAVTDQCHDITVFSEIGLAAGACSGNGILLDIRDPVNPRRIDEVSDPNFAYWHSATFNNDGTKVLFTDEWGGGTSARCLATDRPEWGANAFFELAHRQLRFSGYYKLPAPQTAAENCVAHNGSIVPVPGRDIMVQAWYQGGVSVVDFTNPARPVEIAYFDRGPMADSLLIGGHWSAYWYNGNIYASEIGRGLDVFRLTPSEFLSQNEIDAANLVRVDRFNPQDQKRIVWPARFVVARAYLDGLVRSDGLRRSWATPIYQQLSRAERVAGAGRRTLLAQLATQLDRDAQRAADPARVRALARVVRELANSGAGR
jgi:hypothetical protein